MFSTREILDRIKMLWYNIHRWRDKRRWANVAQLVEQPIRNQQVGGSSPFIGSIYRGVAQFGSAFGSGPKGRRFKSCHLDHRPVLRFEEPGFLLSTICPKYAVFCEYFGVFCKFRAVKYPELTSKKRVQN